MLVAKLAANRPQPPPIDTQHVANLNELGVIMQHMPAAPLPSTPEPARPFGVPLTQVLNVPLPGSFADAKAHVEIHKPPWWSSDRPGSAAPPVSARLHRTSEEGAGHAAPRPAVRAQTTPRDLPQRPGRWTSAAAPLAKERPVVKATRTFADPTAPTPHARAALLESVQELLMPQLAAMNEALRTRTPSTEAAEACVHTLRTLAPLLGALQPAALQLASSAQASCRLPTRSEVAERRQASRPGSGRPGSAGGRLGSAGRPGSAGSVVAGFGGRADGVYFFEAAAAQQEELAEVQAARDETCSERDDVRRELAVREAALATARHTLGQATSRVEQLVADLTAKQAEASLKRRQQQHQQAKYEASQLDAGQTTRSHLEEQAKLHQRIAELKEEILNRERLALYPRPHPIDLANAGALAPPPQPKTAPGVLPSQPPPARAWAADAKQEAIVKRKEAIERSAAAGASSERGTQASCLGSHQGVPSLSRSNNSAAAACRSHDVFQPSPSA